MDLELAWMDPQADGWFFGESYNEVLAKSNIHMLVPCADCERKELPCAGKVHVPDPTADAVEGGVQIHTLHAWHHTQIEAHADQAQDLQAEKEKPVHHNEHQIHKGWMTRCCELPTLSSFMPSQNAALHREICQGILTGCADPLAS